MSTPKPKSESKKTNLQIMREALARQVAIKNAVIILKRYPELLAAEPKLAEFVSLLEPTFG